MVYDMGEHSLPVATKENDWLGFCPAAVKLQNGDKKSSLKKRTAYTDSFSASGVTTFSCAQKGCAFQGHVSVDFVWKVTMKDEKLGLQCRWAFLAKSHMMQGLVTGRQYQYQCPICIYTQGHAEGRIWKGTGIFLEHVSTHRGKHINDEVLHKLNIINEYCADEKENYDLNLFPPGFDKQVHSPTSHGSSESSLNLTRTTTHHSVLDKVFTRKESHAPIDIGSGMQRQPTNWSLRDQRDRADSVVAGAERPKNEEPEDQEPWCAGLSVIHRFREKDYLSDDF